MTHHVPGNASVMRFYLFSPSDSPFVRFLIGVFSLRANCYSILLLRWDLGSDLEGMQFVETMLVGLPSGYKVAFQG